MNIGNSIKFMRNVRGEMGKITWPKLKDTRTMTIMVFILVVLVAVYLLVIDFIIGGGIRLLLGA